MIEIWTPRWLDRTKSFLDDISDHINQKATLPPIRPRFSRCPTRQREEQRGGGGTKVAGGYILDNYQLSRRCCLTNIMNN